ncbi:hypothetical protein PVK06_031499 [Gossypium arboreum]|uniref:Uncharacterized protein n=1 Tax=Gossypium arboreum TaxID=29729 RepID=A0ABR0NRF6_GOSAR|nr:hypothetical protein PVK06_031499 [Gossypium arboreum]
MTAVSSFKASMSRFLALRFSSDFDFNEVKENHRPIRKVLRERGTTVRRRRPRKPCVGIARGSLIRCYSDVFQKFRCFGPALKLDG